MKKYLQKIKREIGRRVPEDIKAVLRRTVRFIKPVSNPIIPVEELQIFELLKDEFSTVFDVGAREDLSFYAIKNDCVYHLFEPSTAAIASLKKQISLLDKPDIILNEFGLSDTKADNCVYYEDSQSFVINPFHKGVDKGQRYSLRTLDDYVQSTSVSHIDFLKIDAEGLDYKIIQGGLQTITTKVSYIQFEYWDGVKKFTDLLGDSFNFYLMMEPRLLGGIFEDGLTKMTDAQKKKDYTRSIIPVDEDIIDLIDRVLAPMGWGGNILGVTKNIPINDTLRKITFDITSK